MNQFAFARARAAIVARTAHGLAQAAATLATALRARGLAASVAPGGETRARVHIAGADLVAREFGTLRRAASPVVSPIVRANAQEIARAITAEITNT